MTISLIRNRICWIIFLFTGFSLSGAITGEDYKRAENLRQQYSNTVYKKVIQPNWFDENKKFWYRNELKDSREFIVIDAEAGGREIAFDHQRLAESLARALSRPVEGSRLPFERISFSEEGKVLEFDLDTRRWRFSLDDYQCLTPGGLAKPEEKKDETSPSQQSRGRRRPIQGGVRSPDGKWVAAADNYNLFLKSTADGREFRVSHDGDPNHYYNLPMWSPDSKTVVAYQIEPGDHKTVWRIESSPKDGGRAVLHTREYALPGDKYDVLKMSLFSVETKEQTRVDAEPWDSVGIPQLHWDQDGMGFLYKRPYRSQQRLCLIRVDAKTGKSQIIVDERSDTFVNINYDPVDIQYLDETDEIIWSSERDGWRHLYLYDSRTGQLKNQITKGNWVVRDVVKADEKGRTIIFKASGVEPDRDPYYIQYYRINMDGTDIICLTPEKGTHTAQFSEDWKYLVDTYSQINEPPVHELRNAVDGNLICRLEKADAEELYRTGWVAPEPFTAKGRDGKTDIWGVIWRPQKLDTSKKYPIIEDIYAGPQDSFVPKSWRDYDSNQALAELGFIVVQCDGMGTANRSKAFHDVCWKNLADAGLPDRILWIKAAAEKYPYMDIDRVGIFGTSAGGQSSARAVLFYPAFYKAAVSACGCHDNLMDKSYWNEQWMGYPIGPHYKAQSNITNAEKLQARLMLIVGEMDDNVPPESTYRLADALIKAKKEFELVVIPGVGHTSGEWYGNRKRWDFFVKNLLNEQPPDWNKQ